MIPRGETHSFGYDDECNDCRILEKENERMYKKNKQLREALTSIEWDAGGYCNSCMGFRGHEGDCLVGQALGASDA